MTREEEALLLAFDVFRDRLAAEVNLPLEARIRAAIAAARRTIRAWAPGAVAHIERNQPATEYDETRRPRLLKRARPYIDSILREANVDGDVTERMLLKSSLPWVVAWRDRLCWSLSCAEEMTQGEVAVVVGINQAGVSKAIGRHEKRVRLATETDAQQQQRSQK